ncbi:hypothetical protein V2J09_002086 [Rumex salicifolius]
MLELDNKAGWLIKFSATVAVGVVVTAYVWRKNKRRLGNLHEVDSAEASKLTCFCGLPAKLRISRTSKNPYRLFYNCPKNVDHHQCDYICWSDEVTTDVGRYLEEENFLRDECIRLQQRVDYVQSRREQEKNKWDREKRELMSRFSTVQSDLDAINRKIQEVNESEEMPPVDKSYHLDDEHDDAVIIGTV